MDVVLIDEHGARGFLLKPAGIRLGIANTPSGRTSATE
jgi:hypothetical protein